MNSEIRQMDSSIQENINKIIGQKKIWKSDEEVEFYNSNILGKSNSEIEDMLKKNVKAETLTQLLINETTGDDGGIIALSGFYFQFLITIEYLIEMIEGKWDYIFVDHHQDIILISEKKIRIIQVKTKNVLHATPGETDLYKGWIQKLFAINEIIETENAETEFELITNFLIRNSSGVNPEMFIVNDDYNFGLEVIEERGIELQKKIKEYSQQEEFEKLREDEYLNKLLRKFKISIKANDYFEKVCTRIGDLFHERIRGTKEDIDYLIGYMCSKCYYPHHPSIQVIDRNMALEIREILRKRYKLEVREHFEEEDSILHIKRYINSLKYNYSKKPIYIHIEKYINEFEQELFECVENGEDIFSILSKYIKRVSMTSDFDAFIKSEIIEHKLSELLDLVFCLKILENGKVTIDSNQRSLLLKVVGESRYNIFELEGEDTCEKGYEYFIDTFKTLSPIEKIIFLQNEGIKIILAGDFDDQDYDKGNIIEVSSNDYPTQEEMRNIVQLQIKDDFTKVSYPFEVINGSKYIIDGLHNIKMKRSRNWTELERHIKENLGCTNE